MKNPRIPESHLDILNTPCFGHVATLRPDGMLSAHPVSIMFDGESIWFSTLRKRKKVRNLEADDRIAISIPHPENPVHYLEVRGRAQIESDSKRIYVNEMAKKFMGMDEYPYDRPEDERMVVRVIIEQVSAPKLPS